MTTFTAKPLTERAAKALATIQKAAPRLAELRKLKRRVKRAQNLLTEEFGAATIGQLPDGRILQRHIQRRELEPLPAKISEWSEFQEALPFDAGNVPGPTGPIKPRRRKRQ